jgi:pimeloyl-ACP methyl ester carboxylesterase
MIGLHTFQLLQLSSRWFLQSYIFRFFYIFTLQVVALNMMTSLKAVRSTSSVRLASSTTSSSTNGIFSNGVSSRIQERVFVCSDGLKLAAQHYSPLKQESLQGSSLSTIRSNKILMLHGWLANCRSFWKLAPHLPQDDIIALDLPGHGQSDHKSVDNPTLVLAEAVYYVIDVLRQLEWNTGQVTLVGHSMGAAIGIMCAAAFPEKFERLILLDGVGPLHRSESDVAQHIRSHIEARFRGHSATQQQQPKQQMDGRHRYQDKKSYPSREAAALTRQATTARLAPGKQYLSIEAARELVNRATDEIPVPVNTTVEGEINDISTSDNDALNANDKTANMVVFRHDKRLQWPSLLYMTPGQVAALEEAVQTPTLLLLAKDGWPIDPDGLERVKERLKPAACHILPGSHHFHADPDTADEVARHVQQFLNTSFISDKISK